MKITFSSIKVYFVKLKYLFFILLFSFISLPIIIFLRLTGPLFSFRLEKIDLSRIGGSYNIIFYLSEKSCGIHKRFRDIFYINTYHYEPIYCNQFLLKLLKRKLKIIPFWYFGQSLKFYNKLIPFKKINDIPHFAFAERNFNSEELKNDKVKYSVKQKYKIITSYEEPIITLSKKEIKEGYKNLEFFNISRKDKFICFANRDSNYLNEFQKGIKTMNIDFSYHNYRDSNIHDYLFAANELTKDGYFLIRTGKFTDSKLNHENNKIIDYSQSPLRSDFMDFFLSKECEFYICSDSGISVIPESFKTPIVFVNNPSIRNMSTHNNRGIIILKKIYCQERKRLLKFDEIIKIENEIVHIGSKSFYEKYSNLKIIDNTPEEINAAVQEMKKILNNEWDTSFFNQNLQMKFWHLICGKTNVNLKSKKLLISNSFLEKYRDLLPTYN